jgi:hypothetical protein
VRWEGWGVHREKEKEKEKSYREGKGKREAGRW